MYKYGENHTIEHVWSENDKELLTQLYFQLVRSNNLETLEIQYRKLLRKKDTTLMYYLYKLISQSRDIIKGKENIN